MKRLFFLFGYFLIFSASELLAQDFKSDIQTINKVYKDATTYSMSLTYKAYENYTSTKALDIQEGSLKKQEINQFYQLGMIETLTNKKYSIFLDKESKQMVVGNYVGKPAPSLPFVFDNASVFIEKSESIQGLPTQRAYKLTLKNSEFRYVELFFNSKTFFVEKIVLYYAAPANIKGDNSKPQNPKMEIVCSNIDFTPISQNTFSEDKYFTLTKSGIKPKAPFTSYRIINNLRKK